MRWEENDDPQCERVYRDVVKMLGRQKTFNDILERFVTLADASGRNREMAEHFEPLFPHPSLPRTMSDLLQRRGGALAEEGNHASALRNQYSVFFPAPSLIRSS